MIEAAWDIICNSNTGLANSGSIDFGALWDWSGEGFITKEGNLAIVLILLTFRSGKNVSPLTSTYCCTIAFCFNRFFVLSY